MRRIALLCVVAGGIACGGSSDNSVEPRARGVEGVYALMSVNGQPTPLLLGQNDTAKLELLESKMTLNTDASFNEIYLLRLTDPSGVQTQTDTLRGTFTHVGARVVFQPADGSGAYQMEVTDENTLTENDPGYVLVYRRP